MTTKTDSSQQARYSRDDLRKFLPEGELRVDLGCGSRKRAGHIGLDTAALPGVDITCDLEKGLPFEDGAVDAVWSNFLFEHVSDTVFLFQELYRVCRGGAKVEFRVPYYQSMTQYKDPTHKAVILPETMRYFTADNWYGSDYGIRTNFKLVAVKYDYLPPFDRLMSRKLLLLRPFVYPFVIFARRFLWNVVHSVTMELTVIK
jgi:SAM-dependent methyltransferase